MSLNLKAENLFCYFFLYLTCFPSYITSNIVKWKQSFSPLILLKFKLHFVLTEVVYILHRNSKFPRLYEISFIYFNVMIINSNICLFIFIILTFYTPYQFFCILQLIVILFGKISMCITIYYMVHTNRLSLEYQTLLLLFA